MISEVVQVSLGPDVCPFDEGVNEDSGGATSPARLVGPFSWSQVCRCGLCCSSPEKQTSCGFHGPRGQVAAWITSTLPDLRFWGKSVGADGYQLWSPTDLGSSPSFPTHLVFFSAEKKIILSSLL